MTGFEDKLFKDVILNWLYHPDVSVVMDASTELRKRFTRIYPRPVWAQPTGKTSKGADHEVSTE